MPFLFARPALALERSTGCELGPCLVQTGCYTIAKLGFTDKQIFEGHTHYIMALAINPKDTQTFASACLDHTVKVWSLGNPVPNFSLDAHEKGVNYVDYYHGGDRPYIVTTGDDR